MSETITVTGLKECGAALAKLPLATSRAIQRDILTRRGQPIADTARELAPRDEGDLRESIRVGDKLSKRQAGLHHAVAPTDVEVFVGAGPLPQAHLQEFGTVNNAAQPFMRPAWDAAKQQILTGIAADLWASIVSKLK